MRAQWPSGDASVGLLGIAALFSSVLAGLDGGVRIWVDLLHTNFKAAHRFAANKIYFWLAVGLSALGVLATWFFEYFDVTALEFFFISAMLSGFAMAAYVPTVLYMNLKHLPEPVRPKPINILMVSIGAATYISFAVYTVAAKYRGRGLTSRRALTTSRPWANTADDGPGWRG